MNQRPILTLVIPTFNEASIIESSLKIIADDLGDLRSQTEIIIADDGSDNLPEIIERCGAIFDFMKMEVMRNNIQLGKGISIGRAFSASRGEIAGFIDIDLSVAPFYIHDAIREIRAGHDICIAKRQGSRWKSDKSFATSLLASTFAFIHKWFLFGGRGFSDTQCGFKFFKRAAVLDLYEELVATDGLVDLEVLVKSRKRGYTVKELIVPRINDREGKRKLSKIVLPESWQLFKLFIVYTVGIKLRSINTRI